MRPSKVDFKWQKDEKSAPATSKYHAQRTQGYASKKEAEYANQLALRQKAGEVWFWLEQVPFKLTGAKHRVDFLVFYCDGRWELVEVKGFKTAIGELKRKMVEDIYKVHITVI